MDVSPSARILQPPQDSLGMENLQLLQFYHLHTSKQMSLHSRRSQVWQRAIPELATKSRYLMHLLLALGGIHMITHRLSRAR